MTEPTVTPEVDEPGPIEAAVHAAVESLPKPLTPAKMVQAALSIKLARVLDKRGDEEPASQTAKAVDTLRITINQMTTGEDHDPNLQRDIASALGIPTAGGSAVSAPIRYPKVTRPADTGPGGGPDSGGAR